MPVGDVGISTVDPREIAEIAVGGLLRRARQQLSLPLPREVIEFTGPDALTGELLATIWSGELGKRLIYGGNDLDAYEAFSADGMPSCIRPLRQFSGVIEEKQGRGRNQCVSENATSMGFP